ncbi:MAG TPA: bifunctional DNA-formamidopyrimidine glycosylase/DNA-(apurinic or apyrimidinic site) lyase [Terriglobales bacterium]|nr:bifunctional DNA-formamidopyrimidine glycosylase/DNA-(apurinic or apyrimidinic site) lyase [Terriglobales bacterium]
MPELPEVETIARGLAKRVTGDVIESVWIGERKQPLLSPAHEIATTLEGARLAKIRRVGKHIAIDLERKGKRASDHAQWIVHLGMTGKVLVTEADQQVEKHTHLIAKLASGRELRYVDPRMFGKLKVVREVFRAPGQEPLEVSFENFVNLFHGRKTPIKSALLNQKLLSGVGNIYADEALARAGIRPRRRAVSVTQVGLRRLYEALKQVLEEAIAAGGSSINDYVDSDGNEGLFQIQHRVYGREGQQCLTCKTAIKRIVISGRSAHYCPKCQK